MGLLSSPLSSLLMLIAIFGLCVYSTVVCIPSKPGAAHLRLCVTSTEEMEKCRTFKDIDCVSAIDGMDCVQKIKADMADITTLDSGDIYLAGRCHHMRPIIEEATSDGPGYYAVAVARRSSHVTMKTLKGSKSCHTGVNKTAGWFIPMSILFKSKDNQTGQAESFFKESCAPGADPGSNLCELCTPNCDRNSNNRYYGYDGAALCLQETDADVAFVKHLTFLSNPNKADFKLLCKDGSTAKIDDYLNCNLAKVPSHAVVAKAETTLHRSEEILETLNKTDPKKLFSDDFGKNKIFSSSTTLLQITTHKTYTGYLGAGYIKALPEKPC